MGKKVVNAATRQAKEESQENQQIEPNMDDIPKKKKISKRSSQSSEPFQKNLIARFPSSKEGINLKKQNKDFQCPICMEIFIYPIKLSCSHSFCMPCIDRMASYQQINKKCSICRTKISETQKPLLINEALTSQLGQYQAELMCNEQKEVYNKRANKYKKQIQKWSIKAQELTVSMQLDIRIGISWKRGKILEKFIENESEMIRVQNELSSQQIFTISTSNYWNLAKYRFFTRNLPDNPEQFIQQNTESFRQPPQIIRRTTPYLYQQHYMTSIWRRLDSQSTILPLTIESIDEYL